MVEQFHWNIFANVNKKCSTNCFIFSLLQEKNENKRLLPNYFGLAGSLLVNKQTVFFNLKYKFISMYFQNYINILLKRKFYFVRTDSLRLETYYGRTCAGMRACVWFFFITRLCTHKHWENIELYRLNT